MIDSGTYKNMRLLVLFDMPVLENDQKKEYRHFLKSLLNDGFMMLQYSVYVRFCQNDSDTDKHIERVKKMKPKYGNVRILKVTENQFESMVLVQGEQGIQEKAITQEQLLLL